MRVEDIVNKVFTRSFMGYDIEQVDLFLDAIIERFEQYEAEKKEMLLGMEYLLNKLESNQNLPITEMKKAIDSGKTQRKRLPQIAVETSIERLGKAPVAREETKPARSIARGAQPAKPMRAPKVSRVRTEQEQAEPTTSKEAVTMQKKATNAPDAKPGAEQLAAQGSAPAAENWLDELLMNLSERDKAGFGEPLMAAQQPDCNNGDVGPQSAEGAEEEEFAEEPEHDSAAIEEEPR